MDRVGLVGARAIAPGAAAHVIDLAVASKNDVPPAPAREPIVTGRARQQVGSVSTPQIVIARPAAELICPAAATEDVVPALPVEQRPASGGSGHGHGAHEIAAPAAEHAVDRSEEVVSLEGFAIVGD